MSDAEPNQPLEARVAELERRVALLDEALFEVIDMLARPSAPLHGDPHRLLMRIFCKIDRCPECFHEDERRGDGPDATTPNEPRLRVVPEVQ